MGPVRLLLSLLLALPLAAHGQEEQYDVLITGGTAIMPGMALAETLRSMVQVVFACFGVALADRSLVYALFEGELLQVKVRLGEYAPAGSLSQPLMLIGNTKALHVRCNG